MDFATWSAQHPTLWIALYFASAALAAGVWAGLDLLTTFTDDLPFVLRNRWAWIYTGGHALAAGFVYLLVRDGLPQTTSWAGALLVGLGWQALLRLRIQVMWPLDGGEDEGAALAPLEALYRRFQEICRLHLDRALMRKRSALVRRLTQQPADWLEDQAKMTMASSQLDDPLSGWKKLAQLKEQLGETWSWYLAYYLLRRGGEAFVEDLLRHAPQPAANPTSASKRHRRP